MIDLSDSCLKQSRPETWTRSAGKLFHRTTDIGKKSIDNNGWMYGFDGIIEGACDECTLQGEQNMTEDVWQRDHKQSYKTL